MDLNSIQIESDDQPVCLALPEPSKGNEGSSETEAQQSLPSSNSFPLAAFPLATFFLLLPVKKFCMVELNLKEKETGDTWKGN